MYDEFVGRKKEIYLFEKKNNDNNIKKKGIVESL